MSCLVFVFIICVVVLSKRFLTYQTSVKKAGGIICKELKKNIGSSTSASLAESSKSIECDADTHILRLGEETLFSSGQYKVDAHKVQILKKIGQTLKGLLLCGDNTHEDLKRICRDGRLPLEAILIEGHTDPVPLGLKLQRQCRKNLNTACIPDNLTLSSFRAIEVYQKIKDQLGGAVVRDGKSLIGVAGYGANRPLSCSSNGGPKEAAACRKKNRRIEIRFVLSAYEIYKTKQ